MTTPVQPPLDPWAALRRHTPARIALGRVGTSLPTHEVLRFAAAHAQARDAVHVPLDVNQLTHDLSDLHRPCITVQSRAPSRDAYLRRPDWGRRLSEPSALALQAAAQGPCELAVVLADGLSAVATQCHGPALVAQLLNALGGGLRVAPLVLATQARVALADEVGVLLQAQVVLILLGERPGLSSPDSLGAYLTHGPAIGNTDAQRNCVSNIRPEGLALPAAAGRLAWLVRESLRRQVSGIGLKDDSSLTALP
jgi:ethanolamine ammonia-lyase small subunit